MTSVISVESCAKRQRKLNGGHVIREELTECVHLLTDKLTIF